MKGGHLFYNEARERERERERERSMEHLVSRWLKAFFTLRFWLKMLALLILMHLIKEKSESEKKRK
jgi:hypothetical protein